MCTYYRFFLLKYPILYKKGVCDNFVPNGGFWCDKGYTVPGGLVYNKTILFYQMNHIQIQQVVLFKHLDLIIGMIYMYIHVFVNIF